MDLLVGGSSGVGPPNPSEAASEFTSVLVDAGPPAHSSPDPECDEDFLVLSISDEFLSDFLPTEDPEASASSDVKFKM